MTTQTTILPVQVTTSAGADVFALSNGVWSESLGQPLHADLTLFSEDPDIDLASMVMQPLSLHIECKTDDGIWLQGLVQRVELSGIDGKFYQYSARITSCMGLLQYSGGCRIFQELSTPDIIKKIFELHGLSGQLESRLSQTYTPRPYCVQFGESDLDFLHRLMEEEGIYYFFHHDDKKHTVILADDISAHQANSGYETVDYRPKLQSGIDECLSNYQSAYSLGVGLFSRTDYDFEKPKTPLLVQQKSAKRNVDLEWFDYPGCHQVVDDGQRLARIRMEAEDTASQAIRFHGNARGLLGGGLFELQNHPSDSVNKKYLVTTSMHSFHCPGLQTGDGTSFECNCSLSCQDSLLPFRSMPRTPRPRVFGPQVATVSGKAGEEIWTDSYGRIKVQFPWDRDGKNDELSSCWVRVAQAWVGKNWGTMSLPRIGDEVIVEFLNGDPDQPIVTGRVYNAERMPPEALPAAQAKTVFRTRSTKAGDATAFHELTFDDTKDKEQILFQSERDFLRVVENNDTLKVGFEKKSPGDRSIEVYNNETIKVGLGSGAGTYSLEAAKSILLKCGDSTIELTPSGVQISASSITLKATGDLKGQGANVTIQADGAAKLSGGSGCNVECGGQTVIKGAMVKIN